MKLKSTLLFCLYGLMLLAACRKGGTPVSTTEPVVTIEQPGTGSPDNGNYHANGDVSKLYYNKADGVNIVVLGDGFIKEDLAIGGNFDKQVKQAMDYLFSVAPYAQNKQSFNVYVVYAESKTRGAAKGYNSTNTATVFNTYFDSQVARLLIVGNKPLANTYAAKAVPLDKAHLIVMLVNDQTYGGSGGSIAVMSLNSLSKYIMVHEIGHTFAGLGDEYVDQSIANNYPLSQLPFMANIDDTSDPTKVKWAKFITTPVYQNIVGIYEGAYYRTPGYYRPELHSTMESLSYASYNAPSREAIVKRIDLILGIPYDFNTFLAADAFSIQPVRIASADPAPALPKNDFFDMKERLQVLEAEKKRLQ